MTRLAHQCSRDTACTDCGIWGCWDCFFERYRDTYSEWLCESCDNKREAVMHCAEQGGTE